MMNLSRVRRHRTAEVLPCFDAAHDFFSGGFFLSSLSTNRTRFALRSCKLGIPATLEHLQILFLQIAELRLDLVETRARARFVPGELRELLGDFLIFELR